jgi:hypothetical protein
MSKQFVARKGKKKIGLMTFLKYVAYQNLNTCIAFHLLGMSYVEIKTDRTECMSKFMA